MKKTMALLLALVMLLSVPAAMAESQLLGGWSLCESIEMTQELSDLFEKAMAEQVGVDYTPMALLATQLVSGTNYCFLCRAAVVYPDALPYYALVYVYQDLSGNASVLEISALELGLTAQETPAE